MKTKKAVVILFFFKYFICICLFFFWFLTAVAQETIRGCQATALFEKNIFKGLWHHSFKKVQTTILSYK